MGTKVLLTDGSYGIIKAVKAIHCDEPETTYNFEVEDCGLPKVTGKPRVIQIVYKVDINSVL